MLHRDIKPNNIGFLGSGRLVRFFSRSTPTLVRFGFASICRGLTRPCPRLLLTLLQVLFDFGLAKTWAVATDDLEVSFSRDAAVMQP